MVCTYCMYLYNKKGGLEKITQVLIKLKREILKTVSVYFCEWNVLILRHVFKHYSSYALYVLFKYIVFCLNWYSIIKAGIICILFSHILRSTRFANLPWVPVVCYWSRFSTGNAGKTAHLRDTASRLVHTVAVLWN